LGLWGTKCPVKDHPHVLKPTSDDCRTPDIMPNQSTGIWSGQSPRPAQHPPLALWSGSMGELGIGNVVRPASHAHAEPRIAATIIESQTVMPRECGASSNPSASIGERPCPKRVWWLLDRPLSQAMTRQMKHFLLCVSKSGAFDLGLSASVVERAGACGKCEGLSSLPSERREIGTPHRNASALQAGSNRLDSHPTK
jgi:hypothetical protein